MKRRILTEKQISAFAVHLKSEEKSKNTIEKYVRDVRVLATYINNVEVTKEIII